MAGQSNVSKITALEKANAEQLKAIKDLEAELELKAEQSDAQESRIKDLEAELELKAESPIKANGSPLIKTIAEVEAMSSSEKEEFRRKNGTAITNPK